MKKLCVSRETTWCGGKQTASETGPGVPRIRKKVPATDGRDLFI